METNPLGGDYTAGQFAGNTARRFSNSSLGSTGTEIRYPTLTRTSNENSGQANTRDESRRQPSNGSYQSIPTENVNQPRQDLPSNAVAAPVNQLALPSRPEYLRSQTSTPIKAPRACRDDCEARRNALEDLANRLSASPTLPVPPTTLKIPDGTQTPSKSYRSPKPTKPDVYSFYQRASRTFCVESHENDGMFEPRTCSYMLLQHLSDDSNIEVTLQELTGSDLVGELKKPRSPKHHCELRVVLSPEHNCKRTESEELDNHYHHTMSPFPFDPSTWETMFELCEFHKAFFDAPKSNMIRHARVDMNGTQSFYLGLHDPKECNLKVFISHKQFERITTVFIHDCSGEEKRYILDRLEDDALQALTIHPLLIFAIVFEFLHTKMWKDTEEMYRCSLGIIRKAQASKIGSSPHDAQPESNEALMLSHSASECLWHMNQLRDFATQLKIWIEEFGSRRAAEDQAPFNNPKEILLGRVDDLDESLREAQNQLKQADRYLSLYRQWLDAYIANNAIMINLRISKSSFQIAKDSRRDQSATKAIAVLSLTFLPGTFFTGIFGLPFFDWDQRDPGMIISPRIWIYITFVLVTTVLIILVWRFWFRLERWRDAYGRHKSIRRDVQSWFMHQMKLRRERREEVREKRRLDALRKTGPLP